MKHLLLACCLLLSSCAIQAAWTLSPDDPVHTWQQGGYEIAIHAELDNGLSMSSIVVLQRKIGTTDWLQMGLNGGEVWSAQYWEKDVADKGGFDLWWAGVSNKINMWIASWAQAILQQQNAVPVNMTPATFQEFRQWLKTLQWVDKATAVEVQH